MITGCPARRSELGFRGRTLRNDYWFPTVQDAIRTLGFFFGAELVERIRRHAWTRVPEHTGLWWRQAPLAGGPPFDPVLGA